MPQRFYSAQLNESGDVTLVGPEAHHLMHVLRVAVGEHVEIFDGCGLVVTAEVNTLRKRDVTLRVVSMHRVADPSREVILGTAVPKGDRFDWLIEKCTELGVTRIVPLVTARSSVDPRDSKLEKLRQTIIAACKQSGRNHLLELSPVTTWSDFVSNEFPNRTSFIAHPSPESASLKFDEIDQGVAVVFAVGPEGGFTSDEVSLAVASGAKPICLGPLMLRIETAAIALVAMTVVS